jgi:hypothetical protein
MVQNQNMLITAALAIVIIIAIGAFAYTNLFSPDDTINDDTNNENTDDSTEDTEDESDETSDENTEDEILLTIIDKGVNYTYTLSDLEEMESVSGQGRKISSIGEISGPYNYTGVSIKSLLKDVNSSNDLYQFSTIANDGYSKDFIVNESNIEVEVYDETGNISANESATMIIAYKEGDQYYTDPDPLRIAFIGDEIPITSSSFWIKYVTTIEIIYLE